MGRDRFPTTHLSAVLGVGSLEPETRRRSIETLVAAYWRPVYAHVRLKWRCAAADAEDMTQLFFARALEKDFFAGYDPAKGRFRTFLRTCRDRFAANEEKAAARLKRGGAVETLPLTAMPATASAGRRSRRPLEEEHPMMQMPPPTAEHNRLKALAGSWTAEETLHPSPWDPPREARRPEPPLPAWTWTASGC